MAPHYNAFRWVVLSPLSPLVWALIAAGLLLSLWTAARGLRDETHRTRRAALLSLRALSGLAVVGLLLEPGLLLLQTAHIKGRFLVLVDSSRSMSFPAVPTEGNRSFSRAKQVADWLGAHQADLAHLSDRFQLEYATFSGDLSGADLTRLTSAPLSNGSRTDLLGALVAAARGAGGRPLSGALLISDGADNVQLAHGIGAVEERTLHELGIPVNTLAVGRSGLRDLAVATIKADDFAFVRNPISIEVGLTSQGYGGESVPVVLARQGQLVATQTVTLDPQSGKANLKLQFTPDQIGESVYTVSVPVLPGETLLENNHRAFVLKIIRDRVRVLLVCGRPSWDERFLRDLLRRDPNVDLVSFFILRGVHDNPHATEEELSLIPFPTEEIFRTQLHSFDLIILQNFAYKPFSSEFSSLHIDSYFPDLKRYVLEGGSLMMIGGENSFGEGGYDQTELADVLPVTGAGLPPSSELFSPHLTDEGRNHPITAIAEGAEASARLWATLPPLPGLNLVRAKPGAKTLLEDPLLSVAGAQAPVLTVAEEGRGRSLALMADSSWFWSFPAEGLGLSHRTYERFFNNAIRWLVRDPQLSPMQLTSEQRTIEPGQPAVLEAQLRQSDYQPAQGIQLAVQILDAETQKPVTTLHAQTNREGTARIEVPNLPPGTYRAIASGWQNGVELGKAEDALAVRESGPETDDPAPRPELLRQLAQITGGRFEQLPASFPNLKAVHESEQVEIGRRQERSIWDRGWPLLLLCLTLGSEWVLRRRWGYL